jgi:hypothetical protein
MIIQSHGGNVAATVTGGTTHLVASDAEFVGETNKVVTAKSKGNTLIKIFNYFLFVIINNY